MDDLKFVPVGFDRFRASVLVEACIAVGLEVRLFASDDSGFPGGSASPASGAFQRARRGYGDHPAVDRVFLPPDPGSVVDRSEAETAENQTESD